MKHASTRLVSLLGKASELRGEAGDKGAARARGGLPPRQVGSVRGGLYIVRACRESGDLVVSGAQAPRRNAGIGVSATGGHSSWEYSLDQSTWTPVPNSMQCRTKVSGLTSACVYYFRFRAPTRRGLRDYSQVVSLLVT